MCKMLWVRATTDDGEPYPEIPESLEFDGDGAIQERVGTCTCWIAGDEPEEKALRDAFVAQCIKPMLAKVSWGNIIIEIR